MPSMDIQIVRKGDPPPWGPLHGEIIIDNEQTLKVVILEGGMTSGQPSVALLCDTSDEAPPILIETSLALLAAAVIAARAAFPEAFYGGPLDPR